MFTLTAFNKSVVLSVIVACVFCVPALALPTRDSLSVEIYKAKQDTQRVMLYYNYGETFEQEQPDSAIFYYDKARSLAQKVRYFRGTAAYASYCIVILNNRGEFRKALNLALETIDIYKQQGSKKDLAVACINAGSEWEYLSAFDFATEYYLKALQLSEEMGDKPRMRIANNNLASVYIQLNDGNKGLYYALKSLDLAYLLKDDHAVSSSLHNQAMAYMNLKHYEKALEIFEQILKREEKNSDDFLKLDGLLGSADAYNALNHFAQANQRYDSVIAISLLKQAPEYEMYAYMGQTDLFTKNKKYDKAYQTLDKGISLAVKLETRLELKDLYRKAADLNELKGNFKEALEYRRKFEVLNDSIIGEKSQATVANLAAKFEFEKKEATIRELHTEQHNQRLYNYLLVGGMLLLAAFVFLLYRNHRHRRKIHQQRIHEFETEKQLATAEAMLAGEQKERSRLAKDLHDGLGGMLSGIKFSLGNVKEDLATSLANTQAFEHCIAMLDGSIHEMRRLAHDLMPEALLEFGLSESLRDLCQEITRSSHLRVIYESFDLEEIKMEQALSVAIYRICQELLNNTLKHARADRAIVQLCITQKQILLVVEDNGIGMDNESLQKVSGIGWKNIESRVQYHKGHINLQSGKEKGTSVHIEFILA